MDSDLHYFDTHCHLNHSQFEADWPAALERARAAGVRTLLLVGFDLPSSRRALELAVSAGPGLWAAVGIHPHDAEDWSPAARDELGELAAAPQVAAIGEIGLDFFRDLSPRDSQARAFRAQLELAAELGLPIIVHTRDSVTPSLDLIEPFARNGLRGIMHCWSGTAEEARRARELGLLLGIGGVLTYKKPGALPAIAVEVGLPGLVLETDSPYLSPTPHRGRRNEPAYLPLVAERLAALLEVPAREVAAVTRANARSVLTRVGSGA
jgi:TatD DNase family protein